MKLTRASIYALQGVAYLSEQKDNRPTPSHHIAKARGIPERFLLKVLKPLVSTRVLLSIKGPNGGYRLAKAAGQISLLEVVEAVDGPIRGQVPTVEARNNERLDRQLEKVCIDVAEETRKGLRKVTVAELTSKGGKRK
jgi:Rrf2 family protein